MITKNIFVMNFMLILALLFRSIQDIKLNYELLIAQRLAFTSEKNLLVSRPIIRIAMIGVALGFAVMIIAVSIVTGFKKEIRDKVIGFGAHIQVSNFDENNSYETRPISRNQSFLDHFSSDPGIKHIQVFATKAGIVKTKDEIEGIVAKGIGKDFDWTYFHSKLVEGKIFSLSDTGISNKILISKNLSRKLNLKTGDPVIMYFMPPPRARKFIVSGIYETGLEEFDNLYAFCDIAHIRKLNDWTEDQVSGFEITVSDFDKLNETGEKVYAEIGPGLNARTIKEIYPQIFDWLGLQNINAIIILTLMIVVSGMNMISALLIIILERIKMIGTIKAMGMPDVSIRKIFIYLAGFLIGRGLLWGNIIGLLFVFAQKYFGLIQLDQESYYLSYVPVNFSLIHVLLLNSGTLLVCTLMMILPTIIITRISPLTAIRYA
jgi:lipoprotein-releasing system permease protein